MEASLQSSLGTLYLLVGSISAISSISIILYILINKCRRNKLNTIQRFIRIAYVNIAFSDLLFAISNISTGLFEETELYCVVWGYSNQLGAISSFLWVLTTAVVLYLLVHTKVTTTYVNKCINKIMLMVWSVSVIIFTLPPLVPYLLSGNIEDTAYGDSVGHCWIKDVYYYDHICRWLLFHIPVLIIIMVLTFIYYDIYKKFKHDAESPNYVHAFAVLPLVLMFCFFIATIRRAWDTLYWIEWVDSPPKNIIIIFQALTMASMGWLDAVVMLYFLNGRTCRKNDVIEKDTEKGHDGSHKPTSTGTAKTPRTSTGQTQPLYSHIKDSDEKEQMIGIPYEYSSAKIEKSGVSK
eukprot:19650_1